MIHREVAELASIFEAAWDDLMREALHQGPVALKVNSGHDYQAQAMGGGKTGETGTATSTTATSLTNTGAAFPTTGSGATQGYAGHKVIAHSNGSYGVVLSNTATVLTIDYWHTTNAPGTVSATPTGTTGYTIVPSQAPAWFIGLSTNATAPAAGHTFLDNGAGAVSELWASGGGLNRAVATYAHTAGTNTYTLTKTFTANANDGASNQIQKIGVFAHGVTAAPTTTTSGTMLFSTAVSSPPTLVSGDQLTITETVTM